MIHLYFMILFFSGMVLTSTPVLKVDKPFLKMALSPVYAIFLPSLIVMSLHILKVKLTLITLLIPWGVIVLTAFYYARKDLILLLTQFYNYLKKSKKFEKIILFTLFLLTMGLFLRSVTREIWAGDGQGQLAIKALEWAYHGQYHLSGIFKEKLAIYLTYPLYHVIGMTINQIIFMNLSPFTIKLFDTFYTFGILLISLFFFSNLIKNIPVNVLLSLTLTFVCRNMASAVNSGYADIDILFYLFLGTSLLLFQAPKNFRDFFHLGLVFALLIITKSEGVFRFLILLFSWALLYRPKQNNIRKYSFILIPIVSLYLMNKSILSNVPSDYRPYISQMNFSIQNLIDRFPLVMKGLFYSYKNMTFGPLKAYWPISFILLLLSLINFYIDRKTWDQFDRKIIKIFFFLLFIFVINTGFNIAPTWISPLPEDLNLETPEGLAGLVLVRLNGQIHFALTIPVILGLIFSVKKSYFERTEKNVNQFIIK